MLSQSQTPSSSHDNDSVSTSTFTQDAQAVKRSFSLKHRDTSPSRLSIHSTSTTSTSPQLKRKLAHSHIRRQLDAAQNASVTPTLKQSLHEHRLSDTRIETSPSRSSHAQLNRSNTAPSPKRPPASHSSYGIETTAGPPPSFDTQRTRSQERVWRGDRSKSLRITATPELPAETSRDSVPTEKRDSSDPVKLLPTTSTLVPADLDDTVMPSSTQIEETSTMETLTGQGQDSSRSERDSKTSSESHKSEDIFLNIARVDSIHGQSSKTEKRKSRTSSQYYSSGARPATSYETSTSQQEAEQFATPRADLKVKHRQRASIGTPLSNPYPHSLPGGLGSSEVGSQRNGDGVYSKRSSTLYADTIRPVQRSNTNLRNTRIFSDSGYVDRPKYGERNTTESSVSTAAPSTVWDELDDLKSRIRKLELTGKLPQSSAAAMSSAERPRTATTAATTMSASPKQTKVTTPLQPTIEGVSSTLHPLLHDALTNAKSIVSHDIFQKLQATAQDALQLAAMTNHENGSVRSSIPTPTDRQLRRRTESLCRNLTEMAIALAAESKAAQHTYRPASREYHISPHLRSRRYSQDSENPDRATSNVARVHSRLDTRRASMQAVNLHATQMSPDGESPTMLPQQYVSQSSILRPSGTFRNRRTHYLDGANDENESTTGSNIRPVSRAMTDVAGMRRFSRDHASLSREYTNQHPMPTQVATGSTERSPLPSHLSTNFISRRKFQSPVRSVAVESSPLAPKPSWSRISIVHQDNNESSPRPADTASEGPNITRSVTARRTLGFASRLGSTVGSRLRASKPEKADSRSPKTFAEMENIERMDQS